MLMRVRAHACSCRSCRGGWRVVELDEHDFDVVHQTLQGQVLAQCGKHVALQQTSSREAPLHATGAAGDLGWGWVEVRTREGTLGRAQRARTITKGLLSVLAEALSSDPADPISSVHSARMRGWSPASTRTRTYCRIQYSYSLALDR